MYRPAAAHRIVILVTYSNMFYSYIMEIRLNSLVAYIYGLRHRQGKQAFFCVLDYIKHNCQISKMALPYYFLIGMFIVNFPRIYDKIRFF